MTPAKVETNPSDDKLREHLLTDEELRGAEAKHPGQVRVLAVGRYNARLQAGTYTLYFALRKWPGDDRSFNVRLSRKLGADFPNELYRLSFHRAAEAMLALRRGHMEYRLNRRNTANAA